MKNMLQISIADANNIFSIGTDWNVFRIEIINGTLDIKFRRKYLEDQIQFNEEGYEYKSIWINPENLNYYKVIALNNAGYFTPYNNLKNS